MLHNNENLDAKKASDEIIDLHKDFCNTFCDTSFFLITVFTLIR